MLGSSLGLTMPGEQRSHKSVSEESVQEQTQLGSFGKESHFSVHAKKGQLIGEKMAPLSHSIFSAMKNTGVVTGCDVAAVLTTMPIKRIRK